MAFDDRPSDFYGEENLASYSRESFTTVANSNAGGAIGLKLRPVLQAQISSGRGCTDSTEGFTDLRFLGQALPDSATAVGPWDSISATGGSGRRVGLVQQASAYLTAWYPANSCRRHKAAMITSEFEYVRNGNVIAPPVAMSSGLTATNSYKP